MRKNNIIKHRVKRITKSTTGMILALTLILQLCSPFAAQADVLYGEEYDKYGSGSKITNVTGTYDDGTTYTAEYRYNDRGRLISEKINAPDGNKSTTTRTYSGDILVSETIYGYDAYSKLEETTTTAYRENGSCSQKTQMRKSSDGTVQFQKEWQFDESVELLHYKAYEYNEARQEQITTEKWPEGEGDSRLLYTVEMLDFLDRGRWTVETWERMEDERPVQSIITNPAGMRSIENYTYNENGDEIIYIKTNRDGTTKRRETTYTKTGQVSVTTDSKGNTTRNSITYDEITEYSTEEKTSNYADGSSRYEKNIETDYYRPVSYLCRETSADGAQTLTEITYRIDGSYTTKEKTSDGAVTVTETNAEDENISRRKILPRGITAETTWTKQADGLLANEITRYSDGTEDRIDYEYDEGGAPVKWTETRRNGVSAVTEVEYTDEEKSMGNQSTTFNNGYQSLYVHVKSEDGIELIQFTYSEGDVYQDISTGKGLVDLDMKTIYRDGRTEKENFRLSIEAERYDSLDISEIFMNHYESFIEEAWTVLPTQTAGADTAAAEATPGNAI